MDRKLVETNCDLATPHVHRSGAVQILNDGLTAGASGTGAYPID